MNYEIKSGFRFQCDLCGNIREADEKFIAAIEMPRKIICRRCIKQLVIFIQDNPTSILSM